MRNPKNNRYPIFYFLSAILLFADSGVVMSRVIIIIVFGTLLILCIGAQMISLNAKEDNQTITERQNYYYMR
jgi:ABC-type uncharacterized transport system fused permease/ATPase subunit